MDLWVARRQTTSESFAAAEHLGPTVNSPDLDWEPSLSADGMSLFFTSDRPGGHGGQDIWVATRASISAPFDRPRNLGPVLNSTAHDVGPNRSADGSTLFFMSDRPGGLGHFDLWQASNRRRARPRE